MASSSVPSATVPAATAAPGSSFGFASKTKKKHFVQQKVKVFRAADPLVGVFLWGVAHSVRPGPSPGALPEPSAPVHLGTPGSRLPPSEPLALPLFLRAALAPAHQPQLSPQNIFSL